MLGSYQSKMICWETVSSHKLSSPVTLSLSQVRLLILTSLHPHLCLCLCPCLIDFLVYFLSCNSSTVMDIATLQKFHSSGMLFQALVISPPGCTCCKPAPVTWPGRWIYSSHVAAGQPQHIPVQNIRQMKQIEVDEGQHLCWNAIFNWSLWKTDSKPNCQILVGHRLQC